VQLVALLLRGLVPGCRRFMYTRMLLSHSLAAGWLLNAQFKQLKQI